MSILIGAGEEQNVELKESTFLRHAACLGSSGSGKTVACKVICEGLALAGVPVIAVDPQGDIASLICEGDPEVLTEHGVDPEMARRFHESTEVVIWTPGSTSGIPICVNPLKFDQIEGRPEMQVRSLSLVSASLSAILGYDPDSDDGRYAAAIFNVVFEYTVGNGIALADFDDLADLISNMPEALKKKTLRIAPVKRIENIARELRLLTLGTHRLLFSMGVPMTIDRLLGRDVPPPDKRTRISVIYLNSLNSQEEKDFFVAQLVNQLYQWMLQNPNSDLQALFYMDEIAPFLPPVRKTACKDGLRLLFKQARKYGVGCLIATQNPGDIDYRSLAQFSTWDLGRLMVRQDIKKVERIVRSLAPEETDATVERLPKLQAGEFLLISPDQFDSVVHYRSRWLYSAHQTIDEENLTPLIPDELRQRFAPFILDPFALADEPAPEDEPAEEEEPEAQNAIKAALEGPTDAPPKPGTKPPARPKADEPDEVVSLLDTTERPMGVQSIARSLDVSESTLRRKLSSLAAKGEIRSRQVGRRKVYWRSSGDTATVLDVDVPVFMPDGTLSDAEARRAIEDHCDRSFFYENEEIGHIVHSWLPLWRFRPGRPVEGRRNPLLQGGVDLLVHTEQSLSRIGVVSRAETFAFRDPESAARAEIERFAAEYGSFRQATPGELPLNEPLPADVTAVDEVRHTIEFRLGFSPEELALVLLPIQTAEVYRHNEVTRRTVSIERACGRLIETSEVRADPLT